MYEHEKKLSDKQHNNVSHNKQGVALTGRNRTGQPCSVGLPISTRPAAGRPARRQRDLQTTTDTSQQNNINPLGRPVNICGIKFRPYGCHGAWLDGEEKDTVSLRNGDSQQHNIQLTLSSIAFHDLHSSSDLNTKSVFILSCLTTDHFCMCVVCKVILLWWTIKSCFMLYGIMSCCARLTDVSRYLNKI